MPDIANAYKFQRKMIAVESVYLKQIAGYRRDARRVMLEIIERDGVTRQAVNQMVNTVSDLSRLVNTAASAASREARKNVMNYTRKQIQLAEKVGLAPNADIAPVLNAGLVVEQDAEQSYMTSNSAWLAQLETSIQTQVAKLRISQASPQEITDRLLSETLADGRASVWLANGNQAKSEETTNLWSYSVGLLGAYMMIYNEQQPETKYQKQAIATIDERTTDCCLRAHGQIQPLDEPFHLTGTPRFADEVQDPPFHWYCRTSEALYNEAFEEVGITTEKMKDMAQIEIEDRELMGRQEIHPSHSTSRRAGALPSG